MPPIPNGDGEIVWHFTLGTDPHDIVVTQGISDSLGALTANVASANLAFAAFADNVLPDLSDDLTLQRAVFSVGTAGDPDIAESSITPDQGGVNFASVPPQVAVLVRKNSGVGGRKNRGRLYLPGCRADEVDSSGTVTPTTTAAIQAACTAMFADLEAGGMQPAILHGTGLTPTDMVAYVVSNHTATQRRRQSR